MDKPPSSFEEISALTTQDLLDRARNGSQVAWEVFYRRYRAFLVFAVRMRLPGFAQRSFDAEDVLQSAFLSAWQEIQRFEYAGEGSFRNWLREIVLNNFRNKLRHHGADQRAMEAGFQKRAAASSEGERDEDPALHTAKEEEEARLLGKLSELPGEDQEILGMRIFERLSWTEIGKILKCDRATVRRRCVEAIKRLERLFG
ncbi:MAG: sigma-70 family RNA polymerase sigma factor [Planctomycetota bacterium]